MSDGGDGFGEIIGGMMGAEPIEVETIDTAHRPHKAKFWLHPPSSTAIIEAAQVNGLALLPPGEFHPFQLDTFGLGAVYRAAIETRVENVLIGIGGSSTNDGGFGLARSLGWRFLDEEQKEISNWTDLDQLERIIRPMRRVRAHADGPVVRPTVAVDVQNPLLGPNGASRIYGPQKGLRQEDMEKAESCLSLLAKTPIDFAVELLSPEDQKGFSELSHTFEREANAPGAGAAGGLGFGLQAFCGARFESGFDVFAKAARLHERLKTATVVISGEGAMDSQSLMGKGVGSLFRMCRETGIEFIGLAGSISPELTGQIGTDWRVSLSAIVPNLTTLDQAKAQPHRWLGALATQAAKRLQHL
jgi:glycerate kinase